MKINEFNKNFFENLKNIATNVSFPDQFYIFFINTSKFDLFIKIIISDLIPDHYETIEMALKSRYENSRF